ncbi:hypothetical protein [Comamonas sp. UBA7528]|uniref:hypothetical protein n=1 Tax=Comamonas sp. UBA7528 TaxID=1946391 RepID=UPI001B43872D|nr:hypothetical protein [Comamonas sp. UBA7528]MBP7352340.1 hypothetical protein [Comamonas sp.]
MRKQWMAAAAAVMTLVGAAHAESTVSADAETLQKAQVQADLELWHKSGMSFMPSPAQFPDVKYTPEYRKYEQLRNGPAFQETVAKYMGSVQTTARQGQATAQP